MTQTKVTTNTNNNYFENVTVENVEAELQRLKLFDEEYESDDDTIVTNKLKNKTKNLLKIYSI
jgi:hypothetical protein